MTWPTYLCTFNIIIFSAWGYSPLGAMCTCKWASCVRSIGKESHRHLSGRNPAATIMATAAATGGPEGEWQGLDRIDEVT